MRLLSFNILSEGFIDYENLEDDYSGISPKKLKLKTRLPKIIKTLIKSKADIMFLQEVDPRMHKVLKKNMTEYRVLPLAHNKSEDSKQQKYGNTTLLRKGVFKGVKQENLYPFTGNVFNVTHCSFKDKKLMLVNLHLDADKSNSKRKKEAKFLVKYLEKHTDKIIVLSGDFNTDDYSVHKYFKGFMPSVRKHTGTYLDDAPMIDWIYVYNAVVCEGKVVKDDHKDGPLKFGSDHYGIICEMQFNKKDCKTCTSEYCEI